MTRAGRYAKTATFRRGKMRSASSIVEPNSVKGLAVTDEARVRLIRKMGAVLRPATGAFIYRFYGCGIMMIGRFRHPAIQPAHVSIRWITLFYIPILPFGLFLVRHPLRKTGYEDLFYTIVLFRISVGDFSALFPSGLKSLFVSAALQTIVFFGGVALVLLSIACFRLWMQSISP